MLTYITHVKSHLFPTVTQWLSEKLNKRLEAKALDYLAKHVEIVSQPFSIKAPRPLQHPFHTLFTIEIESEYLYKGVSLGKAIHPILNQLVHVEKAVLKGNLATLTNYLVDSNEVVRSYAKTRYEELNK